MLVAGNGVGALVIECICFYEDAKGLWLDW